MELRRRDHLGLQKCSGIVVVCWSDQLAGLESQTILGVACCDVLPREEKCEPNTSPSAQTTDFEQQMAISDFF